MPEKINVNPKVDAKFIVVGIGKGAKAEQDGQLTPIPYNGLVWMLFMPDGRPFMVVPLPRKFWLGWN